MALTSETALDVEEDDTPTIEETVASPQPTDMDTDCLTSWVVMITGM